MSNKRSSAFKISVDSERPESLLKSKRDKVQAGKSGHPAVTVFVFAALLIGAAVLGYIYVEKRLVSGEKGIKNVSNDLETRYAELSEKYAALEESIGKIDKSMDIKVKPMDEFLPVLEKTTDSLKSDLKKAEERIEKIDKSKAGKEELTKGLADAGKKTEAILASIREQTETIDAKIQAMDEKFAKELETFAPLAELPDLLKGINKDIKNLQGEIAPIKSGEIYRRVFDIALKKQEKKFKEEINLLAANLERKGDEIKSLRWKLRKLEKSMKEYEKKTVGVPKPPGLKPGTIIEKTIE